MSIPLVDLQVQHRQVAAEIEKYDPEIMVSTLAYNWSREPPKGVAPRRNVLIRYAPISSCCTAATIDCWSCDSSSFMVRFLHGSRPSLRDVRAPEAVARSCGGVGAC